MIKIRVNLTIHSTLYHNCITETMSKFHVFRAFFSCFFFSIFFFVRILRIFLVSLRGSNTLCNINETTEFSAIDERFYIARPVNVA